MDAKYLRQRRARLPIRLRQTERALAAMRAKLASTNEAAYSRSRDFKRVLSLRQNRVAWLEKMRAEIIGELEGRLVPVERNGYIVLEPNQH